MVRTSYRHSISASILPLEEMIDILGVEVGEDEPILRPLLDHLHERLPQVGARQRHQYCS